MGGRSKASTSTASTQTTTNQTAADYSTGAGNRTTTSVSGSNNTTTINTSDYGAVQAGIAVASDSAKAAIGLATQSSQSALQAVQGLAAQQDRQATDNLSVISNLAQNLRTDGASATNKMLFGLLALAVVAGVVVVVMAPKGSKAK